MSDTPANPNPFRLSPGEGFGFSDAGERVAVAWPECHEPSEDFEDALLCEGFDAVDAKLAAKIHAAFLTRIANRRAAEIMRMILARMAQTKTGKTAEFRAFLAIFSPDRTLEEIATEAGISRQSIHFHVQKLRPILTPTTLVGDDYVPAE